MFLNTPVAQDGYQLSKEFTHNNKIFSLSVHRLPGLKEDLEVPSINQSFIFSTKSSLKVSGIAFFSLSKPSVVSCFFSNKEIC